MIQLEVIGPSVLTGAIENQMRESGSAEIMRHNPLSHPDSLSFGVEGLTSIVLIMQIASAVLGLAKILFEFARKPATPPIIIRTPSASIELSTDVLTEEQIRQRLLRLVGEPI